MRREIMRTESMIEEIDRETCLALLATQSVGLLAMARQGAAPHVVPVNYTLLRGSVVFRTTPGQKLDLLVTEPVSFEVDSWDPLRRTGWSVVIHGLAYEASDREMEYEDISLDTPAERQDSRWVRLMPTSVTGRRITRPAGAPGGPLLVPEANTG